MILRGFYIKIQGLKHNYKYNLEVLGAKRAFGLRLSIFERARGFSIKIRAKLKGFYMVEGPACK
jgi:hypothetical protein